MFVYWLTLHNICKLRIYIIIVNVAKVITCKLFPFIFAHSNVQLYVYMLFNNCKYTTTVLCKFSCNKIIYSF